MKTVIIYYSKHGTTKKAAHQIGDILGMETDYISLKEHPEPDIRSYERVILGTSIYAGRPGKPMSKFCHKNETLLKQKTIGLFICGMNLEQEEKEMYDAFPDYLHSIAVAEGILGGEFLLDKMNFIERFITQKITHIKSSVSNLKQDEIKKFANKMKQSEKS